MACESKNGILFLRLLPVEKPLAGRLIQSAHTDCNKLSYAVLQQPLQYSPYLSRTLDFYQWLPQLCAPVALLIFGDQRVDHTGEAPKTGGRLTYIQASDEQSLDLLTTCPVREKEKEHPVIDI